MACPHGSLEPVHILYDFEDGFRCFLIFRKVIPESSDAEYRHKRMTFGVLTSDELFVPCRGCISQNEEHSTSTSQAESRGKATSRAIASFSVPNFLMLLFSGLIVHFTNRFLKIKQPHSCNLAYGFSLITFLLHGSAIKPKRTAVIELRLSGRKVPESPEIYLVTHVTHL